MAGQTVLVSGGAGFIGSALIRHLITKTNYSVVNVDKLTYAGNLASLQEISNHPRYKLEKTDICNHENMERLLCKYQPSAIYHLAAESHVDRSIDDAAPFITTNIIGTYVLLSCALKYWSELNASRQQQFRFIHVSTDEVYGSLGPSGRFTESSAYQPTSPYSASKAASDHLARAWFHTYGLPVIVTHSSNNYGPCQYPEKLIPLTILNAISGKPLPVYGAGLNIRDWLYVDDHANALRMVAELGAAGETYGIGGDSERTNINVVLTICEVLDQALPSPTISSYSNLVEFVTDRPGHDLRYAIDASKIRNELGWAPGQTFECGIRETVEWYLRHRTWWQHLRPEGHELRRGLARHQIAAEPDYPRLEIV